ncbi:MAG: hypothetical protein KI793_26320, partial [Rivularia sp. (in: Bacteria)]|nr:hypothetical protein [Rivularia sp. MS3]
MASIYVNINAAGAKNGNSWNDAFTDLQSALAAANSGDEIWVAKGIYKPTITTDRSISFELKDNVAVYGGFVGNEVNLSDRVIADIKDNETILSGDNISYSVVKFNNTSGTTILDGLTIADGNSNDDGGGIYNKGNLTLQNSVVRNNQAADDGGGIRNDGNLTIINSTVADNASLETASDTSGGGGLLNTNAANATVTIINSTFFGNTGKNGGAIRNDGTLNLINSTLSGNTASQSGGGLVNTVNPNNPFDPTGGGNATIINSTITNNTAGNQLGGGIANVGVLTVSNSIIAGNTNNDDIENTFTAFGFTFNGISNSGGSNLIGNGEGTSFTNGDNGDIVGDSSNPINPLLANLQDNGGLTKTHALLNGSLAINAGSNNNIAEDTFDLDGNSNTTENLPFEQRGVGFERILDNTVDIGAYEIVSVVEVSATNADGIYKTGDTVDITVKFAKPVSFNSADGLPQLALETGNNDRVATYKSGNNSDTLTFTYTVQSGDESLDLDYLSKTALEYSSTIKDENGNEVDLTLPNPGETDSLSDNKDIVIDAIAPRVTLNSAASETVNDKFSVSAQFSESVNNFDENDIALSNATISNFSGSDANYSFDITPTETGSVTVDINASVATDIPGNNNIAATQLTREADLTSPTVINVIASTPTISDSTTTFELTVEYSEEMDISVNPVITIENTQNTISLTGGSWNSDSKTYIATYSVADANEELSNIDITVENAEDKFGNLQQSFTQQDVFSIDNRNPGVSLNSTAPATVNSTFNVTAEFSELVNDFDISDITLNNATVDNFVESGNNYSFDVTPSSSGKVTIDINSDVATDNAGNNNIAATQLTREADLTSPTVINVIASTPTISDSTTTFELTVEYSEEMDISVNPVISFPTENPDNTILLTGGSWNSDNKTYKATYSVADANEEVADIDITVENAEDKVGNLQQSFTQQDVFSIDNQNPGVSLNSTAPATVNGKFAVIAQFSELVNDFDINDITLTNATASNFVENFTNYTFDVTPINTGEVTIDINSAVATDIPGNNNIAATQLSREADLTSPTVINVISSTPTISDSTT